MFLITLGEILLFASFLIASLIPFINNPDSSSDLTMFIMSSFSLFETSNAVVPDTKIFFWITASVTDAAAVNLNEI